MTRQLRPTLFAFWAVLLCLCRETVGVSSQTSGGRDAQSSSPSASSSDVGNEREMGVSPNHNHSYNYFNKNETIGIHMNESMTTPKLQEDLRHVNGTSSIITSKDNTSTTVISGRPARVGSRAGWSMEGGGAPMCAYRVMEGGIGGRLCFQHTQVGFRCHGDCQTVRSIGGSLVANILINGSVLLQWAHDSFRGEVQEKTKGNTAGHELEKQGTGTRETRVEGQRRAPRTGSGDENRFLTAPSKVSSGWQVRRGGFELRCWWNGSYTQFECTGIHLGSGCRDFLLSELHENVPYRICLHPLTSTLVPLPQASSGSTQRNDLGDCVEFIVSPLGMQDIVIAMTTVGGAICVMLVIICLLVAYITENIMSPTTQHSHTYHTHSRH